MHHHCNKIVLSYHLASAENSRYTVKIAEIVTRNQTHAGLLT